VPTTPRTRSTSSTGSRLVAWRPRQRGAAAETSEVQALRGDLERVRHELETFAAAVVHELRTPLSALSGEAELALSRDRTPATYREALARIAEQVARLIEWTSDLAILGAPQPSLALSSQRASLVAVLGALDERYRLSGAGDVIIDTDTPDLAVAGNEALLTRALTLLIDQGLRYRGDGGHVRLRVASPDGSDPRPDSVTLVLEVTPPRFPGLTWHHLGAGAEDQEPAQAPGLLRLRTAARVVNGCGGSLHVQGSLESDVVEIRLCLACARGGETSR